MTAEGGPELIGAADGALRVNGETDGVIRMDAPGVEKLRHSLESAMVPGNESMPEPARVFLKLEGIRGTADSANYYVYVDVPPGPDSDEPAERLVGSVSLFGVSAASDESGPNAGSGINQVIEISEVVDALHISGDRLDALRFRFVPANETVAAADFSIERVGVFLLGS
jgi:tyrosinase